MSIEKVELPMFGKIDLVAWITRADIYFEVQIHFKKSRQDLTRSLCMQGGTIV